MRISDWSSDVCSSDLHLGDHVLEAIHREVEVEIVHLAGEKMELAAQLRPQGRPIVAGIARQVETMLAHIADDLLVYGSGLLVIEQHGIAVGADRTVRRLQIGRASCRERGCPYV